MLVKSTIFFAPGPPKLSRLSDSTSTAGSPTPTSESKKRRCSSLWISFQIRSPSSREMATAGGVDNTHRRKFDKEEYLERARQREHEEEEGRLKSKSKGPPVQRKPLKNRDYEVDLSSRLGKTQVVTPIAPLSQQAGYYCSVCECVVKDSANYLDHINGKKHQRALGMSMRVERSSLQQVQDRFEVLKKRNSAGSFSERDLDERILKQHQEEEERKRQRRERKKEKKKEKESEENVEEDADVAAMMGFGGFRSSKK